MNELLEVVPDVAVYHDGSGKASRNLASALEQLAKREDVVSTMRAFIAKWSATLAGMNWQVDIIDPEIKLDHYYYRGKPSSAVELARLWPELSWQRVEPDFGIDKDHVRDWTAVLDGVTLRILRGDVIKRAPVAWPSKRVTLPARPADSAPNGGDGA